MAAGMPKARGWSIRARDLLFAGSNSGGFTLVLSGIVPMVIPHEGEHNHRKLRSERVLGGSPLMRCSGAAPPTAAQSPQLRLKSAQGSACAPFLVRPTPR